MEGGGAWGSGCRGGVSCRLSHAALQPFACPPQTSRPTIRPALEGGVGPFPQQMTVSSAPTAFSALQPFWIRRHGY